MKSAALACVVSVALAIFAGAFAGDGQPTQPVDKGAPPSNWLAWQRKRHESIVGTNGWTTLISLYWLPEGTTFAGADPTNQLVLPVGRAPALVGAFIRKGNTVQFEAAPGLAAAPDGANVRKLDMKTDAASSPSELLIGPLSFVIIERGKRFGVRVRDPDSPERHQFGGLQYFPYDFSWRIEGRFEPFPAPQTMRVPDASGGMQELASPGALVFAHAGTEYRLDVVEEEGEEDYFVIFTDRTAGDSTYDAGRFLYVGKPDAAGHVTIDFNWAFTPPCGFTAFATCPRPPPQNSLPFAISAGERKPSEAH